MNEIGRKPAHTVIELASARQHQKKNWPTIMERAVEGKKTGNIDLVGVGIPFPRWGAPPEQESSTCGMA